LGYSLDPVIPIIDNRIILRHCFLMVHRKRTMTMIPSNIFHFTSQQPLFGELAHRRKPLCLWKVLRLIANAMDVRFQGSLESFFELQPIDISKWALGYTEPSVDRFVRGEQDIGDMYGRGYPV